MPRSALLNVVDIEATCWEQAPPAGQISEIIEIGLTVLDVERREWRSKNRLLVRPEQSEISPFCAQLTGLTREDVAKAESFEQVCRGLQEGWGADVVPWTSWGDYDRNQFTRQCERAGIPYPFSAEHINAKRRFAESYGLRRPVGMVRALEIAGLTLQGRHHRADDDSWNVAALVLHLVDRGDW
jgi:inhibitor of KinA sporulation pathway (predicted exonuclease)